MCQALYDVWCSFIWNPFYTHNLSLIKAQSFPIGILKMRKKNHLYQLYLKHYHNDTWLYHREKWPHCSSNWLALQIQPWQYDYVTINWTYSNCAVNVYITMKSYWPPVVADMKANQGILYVIDIVPDSPYRLREARQASMYLLLIMFRNNLYQFSNIPYNHKMWIHKELWSQNSSIEINIKHDMQPYVYISISINYNILDIIQLLKYI